MLCIFKLLIFFPVFARIVDDDIVQIQRHALLPLVCFMTLHGNNVDYEQFRFHVLFFLSISLSAFPLLLFNLFLKRKFLQSLAFCVVCHCQSWWRYFIKAFIRKQNNAMAHKRCYFSHTNSAMFSVENVAEENKSKMKWKNEN